LDELKTRAADLTSRISAERRGYFTPEEEDQVLGLLISYWQTRNALLELIGSLRREFATALVPPPSAFLIGFSAAAILVDAARFLRDVADSRPILREKLNQSAPQFGIPPGVFDTIQRSLVSARNGWHLLQAIQHYRERIQAAAAELSGNDRRLFEITERVVPRLDVSKSQFARAKLNTRAGQIARQVKQAVVDRTLYGLQRLAGTLVSDKYLRPGHRPALPLEVRSQFESLMVPGDVLMVRKEYALTNYFLPGHWPHVALYLGSAQQLAACGIDQRHPRWSKLQAILEKHGRVVLEALKDGVHLRSLESPFAVDSLVVLRPRLDRTEIARGLDRVLSHEGKPYDFDFDFRRSDRLVCTEVVYRALDGLGQFRIPLVRRAGRPTLAGVDFARHGMQQQLFQPIAAFAPGLLPGFHEQKAIDILRVGTEADQLPP
jgi:hypothetical protein